MCLFIIREGDIVITSASPSVRPLCYLLLNDRAKSNQSWCVSSHEWGDNNTFYSPAPLGPGEGPKGQNLCVVITNKRYKTYQTGFLFCGLGGTGSLRVSRDGKKLNMVLWHNKLTEMTSRTECK